MAYPFALQRSNGASTYSNRTFLGNYSEDISLKDDQIRKFISERECGTTSKTRSTKASKSMHLESSQLSQQHTDKYLRFGDVVLLQNADTEGYLSVDVEDKLAELKFGVTSWKSQGPQARNAFRIVKPTTTTQDRKEDSYAAAGEADVVHFGQKFCLAVDSVFYVPLYLTSEFLSPGIFSKMTKRQLVSVVPDGTFNLCWQVISPPVSTRDQMLGTPVPVHAAVLLNHCQTNQNLSSEKVRYKNSFGHEFEVCCYSAQARRSKHGLEESLPTNFWAFVTAPTGEYLRKIKEVAYRDTDFILNKVIAKLKQRAGTGGFRTMVRVLKTMDDNGDRMLNKEELQGGLLTYGIPITEEEAQAVLRKFDRDGSGLVSITEFLRTLRNNLNDRRQGIVLQAYSSFDHNRDGSVNLVDMQEIYGKNLNRNPLVTSGVKTPEQVLLEFMRSWDKDGDATITKEEFIDYYTDLSVNIDDDDYFELMVRNAWHISGGTGWSENTTCRRVLVIHNDGRQTVQEIKNDLGIGPKDEALMLQRLREQGITDIQKIKLYE